MKQNILLAIIVLFITYNINAQNDTMYIMNSGVVVGKYNVNNQVDSVVFYKPFESRVNGYYSYNGWHGHAWISRSEGSTSVPEDFSMLTTNGPLCVSGTVAANKDYSGIVLIGYYVNQEEAENSPIKTVLPTGLGIVVNVSLNEGHNASVRVQLHAPDAMIDPDKRWGANLTEFNKDVLIPWSDFNTEPWDNTGYDYNYEALEAVSIYIPGKDVAIEKFNVCVNKLGPQ